MCILVVDFSNQSDDGNSWEEVRIDYGEFTPKPTSNGGQHVNYFSGSKLIIANNVLYGIIPQGKELRIFRLRTDDGVFSMVHRIPSPKLWTSGEDAKATNLSDAEGQPNPVDSLLAAKPSTQNTSGGFSNGLPVVQTR